MIDPANASITVAAATVHQFFDNRHVTVYTWAIDSDVNAGIRRVRPIHPGEILREDFLPDYALTVSGLADAIGVSRQTINEVLRERRGVSPGSMRSARWIFGMRLRRSEPR